MIRHTIITIIAVAVTITATCIWYYYPDPSPAFVLDESDHVISNLVADMGKQHHVVEFRIHNRTGRPLRLLGISGEG